MRKTWKYIHQVVDDDDVTRLAYQLRTNNDVATITVVPFTSIRSLTAHVGNLFASTPIVRVR